MNYRFLAIDEGKKALLKAETKNNSIHWRIELAQYPQAREMQRLDNNNVLVGYDKGYFICEVDTGKILHDCDKWNKVSSARRLSDGTTLITGLNLEGLEGVCLLTLDKRDNVLEKRNRPGDYVRLMSPGPGESYLFCTNDHIVQTDLELKDMGRFESDGFLHAWKPKVMPDGTILISAGYGAFMAHFSANGEILKTFGRKEDLPAEIEPNFYGSFDIAENGNILVANWQGHGPDNGHKGRQLLCFSPKGDFIEYWSYPDEISSFQGLLLLNK